MLHAIIIQNPYNLIHGSSDRYQFNPPGSQLDLDILRLMPLQYQKRFFDQQTQQCRYSESFVFSALTYRTVPLLFVSDRLLPL